MWSLKWVFVLLCFVHFPPSQTREYANFCSKLPIFLIWTETPGPIKTSRPPSSWEEKRIAFLQVFDSDNSTMNCLDNKASYNGSVSIKIRGRSTRYIIKHQFGLYTYDQITPQQKELAKQNDLPRKVEVPLLGMSKGDSWVLNAPWFDESYLRNIVGYKLAVEGARTWQPEARPFELFLVPDGLNKIDTTDHYQGLYVLIEKIKTDNSRVDIEGMKPTDVSPPYDSGGYIVAKDMPEHDDISFKSKVGQVIVKTPDPWEITEPQKIYLQASLNHLTNAIDGCQCRTFGQRCYKCSNDERSPLDYKDVLDLDSFVDYFLHSELVKNQDAYSNSRYFYKQRDSYEGLFGKWYSGPVWDLNLCFGWSQSSSYKSYDGWLYQGLSSLYRDLMTKEDFVDLIVERYFTLRKNQWRSSTIEDFFHTQKNDILNSGAVARDHNVWFYGNSESKMMNFEASSSTVLEFIKGRLNWMDFGVCQLYETIPKACYSDKDCNDFVVPGRCSCNKCRYIKVFVTEPSSVSHWTVGKKETIKWESSVPTNPIMPHVDIWLKKNGERYLVANATKNDEKNTWVVSDLVPIGSGYEICIHSSTLPDIIVACSKPFTIHGSAEHFLEIMYPTSSSIWTANTDEEIHWKTYGLFKYIEIFYKISGGAEVKCLTNVKNNKITSWNVPGGMNPGRYSIIIREQRTADNNRSILLDDESPSFILNGWTRPSGPATIILTVPISGVYRAGNNLAIRWNFSPETTTIAVNIYMQRGDNVANRIILRADTKNDGKTTVFVPLTFHAALDYRVVVQDTGSPPIEGISKLFELENPVRKLTIIDPREGSFLISGEDYIIKWESTGFTNDVDLFYSIGPKGDLKVIKTSTNNDGKTTWHMPKTLDRGTNYYVHIQDPTPDSIASAISGPITITTAAPTLSPTVPIVTKTPTAGKKQAEYIKCATKNEECICHNLIRSHMGNQITEDLASKEGKTRCNADLCECQVTEWAHCANEFEMCNCLGPVRSGACSNNECKWNFKSSSGADKCISKLCECGGDVLPVVTESVVAPSNSGLMEIIFPILIAASCVLVLVIIVVAIYCICLRRRSTLGPVSMGNIQENLLSSRPDPVVDPQLY